MSEDLLDFLGFTRTWIGARSARMGIQRPGLMSMLIAAVLLLVCPSCAPPTQAVQAPSAATPVTAETARFVLLPGCAPYQELILRLEAAHGMLWGEMGSPSPTEANARADDSKPPRPLVPERLRRRARIVAQWASESHLSWAIETPKGTWSAGASGQLAVVASAAEAVADAAEKGDEAAAQTARERLVEKLNELGKLASSASQMCFSLVGEPRKNTPVDPSEIQRGVRKHFKAMRLCYEDGLRRDPTLTGKVETRFTINRFGLVAGAVVDDTTLPDQQVVECIQREFMRMAFPPPSLGLVTVVYPIIFSPDGSRAPKAR